jgi:hypothetical protein
MEPIFIQIHAGKDVAETLINLAQSRQAGMIVLSGSGPISNVILLDPVSRTPNPLIKETLYMTSMHGTYVNANCCRVPPYLIAEPACSSFSVCFAGDCTRMFGGIVGGKIEAAGVVSISANLFKDPEFHRLTNINGVHQEIEEDDTIYVDRIIPNVNHVTNESNNNDEIYLPDYDVVAANSSQLNPQMSHFLLPTNGSVLQWNDSTHIDN